MHFKPHLLLQFISIVFLILTALLGDFLISISPTHLHKALLDNATHAVIAGVSWLIVCSCLYNHRNYLVEVFLCTSLGSIIDLDHFFKARTLSLKAATELQGRPVLHCTTVPIVIWLLILGLGKFFGEKYIQRLSFLILTAFLSHHIRDSTRRGFWLFPFGSSPPISRFTYILSTCLFPFFIAWIMNHMQLTTIHKNEVLDV